MKNLWIIIILTTIISFVSVNSLQCYYCDDCPTSALKETDLVTCGSESSTTVPDSNFTSSTTLATTRAPIKPGSNETESGANATIPNSNATTPATHQVQRDFESRLDMGCTCSGIECNCDKEGVVLRDYYYTNVTYVCASATFKGLNGKDIIVRGCADAAICTYLPAKANATDCKTCTTDKCNGAYTTKVSMAALMFIFTSFFVIIKQ